MGGFVFDKKEVIRGPETLVPYFEGTGAGPLRLGAELEVMLIIVNADGTLSLPDDETNKRLFARAAAGPDAIHATEEPGTFMFETIGKPYTKDNVRFIGPEIAANTAVLGEILQEPGIYAIAAPGSDVQPSDNHIVISPFATVPFADPALCMESVISGRGEGERYSERPRLLMEAYRSYCEKNGMAYPVTNSAVHVTHGVSDRQHGFEMSRVLAAMMPFFFVLCENRPPYQNGSAERTNIHTGIFARQSLRTIFANAVEQRGLFPDFLFTAQNADDFFDLMIRKVLEQPMLSYWNHDGKFTRVEEGTIIRLGDMQGLGPENVSQFALALSQFWWSFKYKLLPGDGPSGMLHELRDFDSGPEVVQNISLIVNMLALDSDRRAEMIRKLEDDFGIPIMSAPGMAKAIIQSNMETALHRGNPSFNAPNMSRDIFLLSPFGSKGKTMIDFLRALVNVMERHYWNDPEAKQQMDNLRFTAAFGMNNAQLWYDSFGSVEEQEEAIRALTADPQAYTKLYSSRKSWAQLFMEGRLPQLSPRRPGVEWA